MPRKPRINLPHCVYHLMCRSNMKGRLFRSDGDRRAFLRFLGKYAGVFKFRVHAYCLMPDHVHILAESRAANLSEFMRRLLISYTMSYHRRHETRGHVFAGRFRSLVVERGDYMLAASRYIHLNPVRAGLCEEPGDYEWSSMKYYEKRRKAPRWLTLRELLSWFGGRAGRYRRFVEEGLEERWKAVVWTNRVAGGEAFSKRMKRRLEDPGEVGEPDENEKFAEKALRKYCRELKCSPEEFRARSRRTGPMRDAMEEMVARLRSGTDWTFRRIAEYLGISAIYAQVLERRSRERGE